MQYSIDSFAAGQLILTGTNMAECDDALELDQTESHRIHLGKMPFKIGYIQVIINYRPAAVEQFLMWAHQKHGDVIEYHWKSRVISVGSYELAALLLKHPNFQRKGLFTETVTILNPFSLVSISGPDWTRAHWLMVRAIGRISIQDMCSSVKGAVHKLMSSTPLVIGGFVDLYDFAKKATLDAMISEIFGAGIQECESQVIHAGIDAIIGELQGLTRASSQYRISRQRLDALIDFKLETEYFSVIHSTNFHKDSVDLSSTFPPRQWASTATLDLPFNSGCHFLRTLVEQNASNHRSPTKASQSPFSLIQLRDLVINVLLFMGTINPAEACVHAVIEIFRSKHSISQREVWIETENLIGQHDSPDRETGFTRIIRESMRMFPPVAGLSFNRRATADTLIHGWRFKKDDNIICSPYVFHHSEKIWVEPHVFRPARFLHLNSTQSASFMPFSVGARSCPGLKIGYSVAEALLKEMTANIDVSIPQHYEHKRSLRDGSRFHVKKMSDDTLAKSQESLAFICQSRTSNLVLKHWLQLRDLSVNFELASSQLLPKRLVDSFHHRSKVLSLIFAGVQVSLIIVVIHVISLYLLPGDV